MGRKRKPPTPGEPVVEHYGKADAIAHWSSLPDQQLRMRPSDPNHVGSSYAEDGIRITGSKEFIDSVISRFKDMIDFDSNGSRLNITYTQTRERIKDENGKLIAGGLTGSWAFYVRAVERGTKRPQRERKPKNGLVELPTPEPPKEDPRFNAHLKVKARKKGPYWALGTPDSEEPDGWVWIDPSGHDDLPMATFDKLEDADDELKAYQRNPAFKKQDIRIVEVTVKGKGKFDIREI